MPVRPNIRHLSAFASERHYLDHLAPTWAQIPALRKHRFIIPERLVGHAESLGISDLHPIPDRFSDPDVRALCEHPMNVTLVASFGNFRPLRGLPVVFSEHGIGQSFKGVNHPAYCTSPDRQGVELFIVPNEYAARGVAGANPGARIEIVGVPRLDAWHKLPAKDLARDGKTRVAFAFHWRSRVSPEASSALDHYAPGLKDTVRELRRHKIQPLGHGHPLLWNEIERMWRSLRVKPVKLNSDVLATADVLVADCTSVIYEFASLDRPVVVLDAPWFRRDVEHGVRFWDAADVGVRIQEPEQLTQAILTAIADPPEVAARRREIVDRVVPFRDGRSAQRAAQAIMQHVL